jgi:hypothetical protein
MDDLLLRTTLLKKAHKRLWHVHHPSGSCFYAAMDLSIFTCQTLEVVVDVAETKRTRELYLWDCDTDESWTYALHLCRNCVRMFASYICSGFFDRRVSREQEKGIIPR